jgi:4-hydroxymandelate oxidase
VKPFTDRDKFHAKVDSVIEEGVTWVGIEVDVGRGTKIGDREMGFDCAPLSREEIEAIKKRSIVPVVCKGVLSREDAEKCVDAGVDIIFISNHGGHTLDYLPHPFQVMDEIVEVTRGKAEVIVDCGIRRGSDVLKGLAFGASLVGLGRPILYALATGGETGVTDLIKGLTRELTRLMSMVGVTEPVNVPKGILIER